MARRRRITRPPRVLPLLPIAFLGILVAAEVLELCVDVATALGWDDELVETGLDPGSLALEIVVDLAVLVAASLLLRFLVRRWVRAQPPEPPGA